MLFGRTAGRIREYWAYHGGAYTLRRGAEKAVQRLFGTYNRQWRKARPTAEQLAAQRAAQPPAGCLALVIPVYNTDPGMLRALLNSISAQTYENWQAILYDGRSTSAATLEVLTEAEALDSRFRVFRGEENLGIAGNTNRALSLAETEFVLLCDHDDLLSPEALWRMAEGILLPDEQGNPPDMLFSDEDRMTEDGRTRMDPHWKTDYAPVSLLSHNYICHLTAVRRSLLLEIGGLRDGFEGSQDHDLFLRLAERTDRIRHLPYTLYTWRENFSSMSHRNELACLLSGCRAVEEHERRMGHPVTAIPVQREIRLWYEVSPEASVQVLIHGPSEKACAEAWAELWDRSPWTNLSGKPVIVGEADLYLALNRAVAASDAEYILLMDARLRGMNRHFLRELLMYAQREDVSAVTPVLVDDRSRILHGGFAVGMRGGARCVNENLFVTAGGWHDAMNRVHNVAAVSPCAALLRRAAFIPFDESYTSALGMVDWCLRQRKEHRRWAVFTPHAVACMEKDPLLLLSEPADSAPPDLSRYLSAYPREHDPCYSPRFSHDKANYRMKSFDGNR